MSYVLLNVGLDDQILDRKNNRMMTVTAVRSLDMDGQVIGRFIETEYSYEGNIAAGSVSEPNETLGRPNDESAQFWLYPKR